MDVLVHLGQLSMNDFVGFKRFCLIQTCLIKFSRVVSTTRHNLACFNSPIQKSERERERMKYNESLQTQIE